MPFYGIDHRPASMLGWIIRHNPRLGASTFGMVVGEAKRQSRIPRAVTERSLATALSLDGCLDEGHLEDFLSRVTTPSADSSADRP